MGVIVACGFCAKPSLSVVFPRKTMDCSTRKLYTSRFITLNSHQRFNLLQLLAQIDFHHNPADFPDPLNNWGWIKTWPISDSLKVDLPNFGWEREAFGKVGLAMPRTCICPIWGENLWRFFKGLVTDGSPLWTLKSEGMHPQITHFAECQ